MTIKRQPSGTRIELDYYYGTEAEQFSFIRIPRSLIKDEEYADLTYQAKLLYAVLLDRMGMSMRNKWVDSENRVYIIYQIAEIQDDLGFSRKQAMSYLTELEEFGLVEKKRRGRGLPSILYVKDFLIRREDPDGLDRGCNEEHHGERYEESDCDVEIIDEEHGMLGMDDGKASEKDVLEEEVPAGSAAPARALRTEKRAEAENTATQGFARSGAASQEVTCRGLLTSCAPAAVNPCQSKSGLDFPCSSEDNSAQLRSYPEVTSGSALQVTSGGAESGLQEVPGREPLKNKTYMNHNYMNNNEMGSISSYPIESTRQTDGMRREEESAYRQIIAENISLEVLKQDYPYEHDILDGIAELMLETVLSKSETITIASNTYSAEMVKSRFLKLNSEHIRYVLGCLKRNTTEVRNIRKYLLAALFNAPTTMGSYYQAAVNHDMPQYVVG